MAARTPRRRDLPVPLREDAQLFGVNLSGSNMEGHKKKKRSRKQISNNKENHCLQESDNPKVARGCRRQRLENEGSKEKIKKNKRKSNMMKQPVEEPSVEVYSQIHCPYGFTFLSCCGSGRVDTASDIFYVKEKFSSSSELGNEKESKTSDSHQPFNPTNVCEIFGPSDNDQHSPVKRRKPRPSSVRPRGLKHINESRHLEGNAKTGKGKEAQSCASRRRLKFRPHHTPNTPRVKRSRKSLSCSSDEAFKGIGVMSETPEPEVLIKIGIPENEVLEGLARKIPKEWKTLGRRLNMDEAVLDSFHKEEDRCTERAYKMLLKWKQAEGEGATFLMLYNALCHYFVDRKDLAEKFCRA